MSEPSEHAVIVNFDYGSRDLDALFEVEELLEEALEAAGTGELDGNEIAVDGGDACLYFYGPDADALHETVRPILAAATCVRGASVYKRYGPPEDGIREVTVPL
ncbi:MAG: hypothetical protein QM809_08220 [Gordonia sp. (in: high G+C Gram-positive bacteria)]|uniref:hypothetical protein n=1 Tax=Gordonia sp. (in: high G+C Gram-positive bacteria) TaxID=84139 RepID=UPI0039E5A6B9